RWFRHAPGTAGVASEQSGKTLASSLCFLHRLPSLHTMSVSSTPAADGSASVYRHPGFLSFLVARVASMVATQMQAVVVAWQVYDQTRDAMALAYVGLAQFLPMLLLLMPAGDLIDRF